MRYLLILVFWGCVTQSQRAAADYLDYGLNVICSARKAEIAPYGAADREVYSAKPKDCTMSNGRTVRVKLGLGPVYPYGMGGADPEKWLSVWIDKAKVLSKIDIGCEEDGPCDTRVVVTNSGMSVCRKPAQVPFPSDQPEQQGQKETCTLTLNKYLKKKRDILEYPRAGDPVPPAEGSFVTVYAKDQAFCRQFSAGSSESSTWGNRDSGVALPKAAAVVKSEGSLPYEYSGSYQRYSFDINNDGKTETVLGLHSRTHYRDGDVYFVLPGPISELPTESGKRKTDSEERYAGVAVRILPQHWVSTKTPDPLEVQEPYRFKASVTAWWDSDDHPMFETRYLYLMPFQFSGTTYFLSWSQQADAQHWVFVLRPRPDYSVEEACIFQFVRIRY